MTEETIKHIIARVIDNANDALEEERKNKNDAFYKGKKLAYYEILDTIKNDLDIDDQDLKAFGLDVNLEKMFYS
ncbi:MAG: transposase [Candidatus Limiplasma sp.]|nr:transposase [Clostridiales bacterium]MDY3242403.1 transposase [Candidatus Limiplasma sp.]MDY4062968.1 transposase [Candidatus Limiplasma sp.]